MSDKVEFTPDGILVTFPNYGLCGAIKRDFRELIYFLNDFNIYLGEDDTLEHNGVIYDLQLQGLESNGVVLLTPVNK